MLQILGLLSKYSPKLDSLTLVCLLQGCINQGAFVEGKVVHTYLVKTGAQHNAFVWTALADMYAKCGSMEEACKVFDAMPEHNLVTWNVMIAGYVKHGLMNRAFCLFKQMMTDDMHPGAATIISMVQACAATRDIEWGRWLHFYIVLRSFDPNILLDNAMTDMYAKCGIVSDSHYLFERMQRKDCVSWTAIISGYALAGHHEQCLHYFYRMIQQEIILDNPSLLCILNVCASLGILDHGRIIHSLIVETTIELILDMENAIVDMYGKCGCVEDAFQVFRTMCKWDSISWNAMITGFAQSGSGSQVLGLVLEMQARGVEMDSITLCESRLACSRTGLLDIGIFFSIMLGTHCSVTAGQDLYAGLIDLLGRAGRLDEAFFVICSVPFQPLSATWRSLLSACRIHNDLRKAEKASEFVVALEPQSDSAYLLLYNVSAVDRHSHTSEQ